MISAPAVELVSAEDALNLLAKAARVGGDPVAILARAGIPYSFAGLSAGTVRFLTRTHMAALYRECIVTIGWHSSRVDNKPQMHPDEFRLLCHCVITCHTLQEVIARQTMFFRTRGDRLSILTLSTGGGLATLMVDTLRKRKSFGGFLSDLAGLAAFSRLYAWLTGMGVHHFRAGLAYGPPFTHEPVADFFAGVISFNHRVNNIVFPEWLLTMPVARSPSSTMLTGLSTCAAPPSISARCAGPSSSAAMAARPALTPKPPTSYRPSFCHSAAAPSASPQSTAGP